MRKERAISPLSAFPCAAMYQTHWRYRLKYRQLCCATSYQRLNAQQSTKEIYPRIYKLNVGSLRNQMVEPCVATVGGGETLGRRITICWSMAFSSQLKPPLALNCSSLNVFTATHMHFFEVKECGKLCPISPNCCVATAPLQPVLPTCLLEVSIVKWVWETLLAFVSSGLFLLHSLNLMMNFFFVVFFPICLRLLLDVLIRVQCWILLRGIAGGNFLCRWQFKGQVIFHHSRHFHELVPFKNIRKKTF